MKFLQYNKITLLQIDLTHREVSQHPISDTELTSYAKAFIEHLENLNTQEQRIPADASLKKETPDAEVFTSDFKGFQVRGEGSYLKGNDQAPSAESLKSAKETTRVTITQIIHNNKAKALLCNDDLTPACSDLIYKLSNKGVLANFACILCDYKQVKAWSTEDIYNFLAFIYPKEIQANPRAWRSYASKVYGKLQDCKEFLK